MIGSSELLRGLPEGLPLSASHVSPGPLDSITIALTAQIISEHYGAPAMLLSLLLGIAFHFLAEERRCVEDIDVTAKTVLTFGVALLGARISVELLFDLGPELIALAA